MAQTAALRAALREQEEKRARLFSVRKPFSEHLWKWEDAILPDMYDHNTFEAAGVPSEAELCAARQYQRDGGRSFWKLETNEPLPPAVTDGYGFSKGCTLTMAAMPGAHRVWRRNGAVTAADVGERDIEADILAVELRNYGAAYGEDFVRRKTARYCAAARRDGRFHYFGAYEGGRIVGACWAFCSDGYTGIDGLIVDPGARGRYVATTLMAQIGERLGGRLYLHADLDDTPREMYGKMGFCAVDRLYEYLAEL